MRRRFAAPFVVIACGGPGAPVHEPVAVVPQDAAPIELAMVDAYTPVAPSDAAVVVVVDAGTEVSERVPPKRPCWEQPGWRGPCNPPPPPPKPAPLDGRIISLTVRGDAIVIVVVGGSEAGVGKDWRADLVKAGTVQPQQLRILRVDKRTTVLEVRPVVGVDELGDMRVRLRPP